MFTEKKLSTILLAISIVVAFIQVTESRPRMRHHRDDSSCSRCAPGWGVINRCTSERDTKCGKCPRGTYSPHHNIQPCWICSRCGPGLYEAEPCSSGHTDTVCDSCHRSAPENPDYRRKCKDYAKEVFLAPEDASNTGEESPLVNEPEFSGMNEAQREHVLEEDAESQLFDSSKNSMQQQL
ncbi:tumor necrosis factor receptor superfamily member 14-like [Venturia canescens]|uniref:tumor necrosis factor receptor superfamily member 14-like n=1 Tax=Venturia canescens TaxID=32260 RepID=UPI001C9BC975|nr:tumor necrosis factor receptor superfamily member 14-like [Venturia canescens]